MEAKERDAYVLASERHAFTLIGWAKRSADNGYTEHALNQAQAALAIAQAVELLKKSTP
jgi:hypothetical protein